MTAVEFLLSELKKYGSACPKYEVNYVIEIPTHILTELEGQANAMEKEQKILLVQELKDYTKEAQCILGNDEREASEFVDIFYNKNFKSE